MKKTLLMLFVAFLIVPVSFANADVYWTEWSSNLAVTSGVVGTLTIGANTVNVTYTGGYTFDQLNGVGTNFWNPSAPYISATVPTAPSNVDIIALYYGGTETITFSQTVHDPILALVSWNNNTVDFGVPITFLSYGAGYFGSGTPTINAAGTGFYGNGELHGVVELLGDYSSITFTNTTEDWHGFTVGALGLPTNGVPEPTTILFLGFGLVGLAGIRRKIRK
jgi:hypothetical protein